MTHPDLLTALGDLEQLFADRILITREILSPVYEDPTSDVPTGWRVSGRLQRLVLLKKEKSK